MKYTIKKGRHYNSSRIRLLISLVLGIVNAEVVRRTFLLHFSKVMTRFVYFSPECWYSRDNIRYSGWNKLYGFFGFLIHKFSGRFVWQPDFDVPGRIIVALYVYNNTVKDGKQRWTALTVNSVQTGTIFKSSLRAEALHYWGEIGDEFQKIYSEKTPHFLKAEPYFGGRDTAYHDMMIRMWGPWTYRVFKKRIHRKLGIK